MALHKVEEVFVGNTAIPDAAVFDGTAIGTILTNGTLTAGNWGIIDADTNNTLDLTAWPTVTWPDAIKFMFYDATRGARFSQRIEMGSISRYKSEAYVSPTPIAYKYDMTNFVAGDQGDKASLMITLTHEYELKPHKIMVEHTFFQPGGPDDVDGLVRKINLAITEKFPNFKPLAAYGPTEGVGGLTASDFGGAGNDMILIAGRPLPDQTNIHQMFVYDFNVAFIGYYDADITTQFSNWSAFTPTVVRGSILTPAYNSLNVLTAASGNFSPNDATNGSGHEWSVRSHYWKALGQMGHLNRVMFESTPYNPILDTTYDAFTLTFDSAVRMPGESPERTNQPKQVTIYTPNALAGTIDADMETAFADLYSNYR